MRCLQVKTEAVGRCACSGCHVSSPDTVESTTAKEKKKSPANKKKTYLVSIRFDSTGTKMADYPPRLARTTHATHTRSRRHNSKPKLETCRQQPQKQRPYYIKSNHQKHRAAIEHRGEGGLPLTAPKNNLAGHNNLPRHAPRFLPPASGGKQVSHEPTRASQPASAYSSKQHSRHKPSKPTPTTALPHRHAKNQPLLRCAIETK